MASNYKELLGEAEDAQRVIANLVDDAEKIDPNWDLVSCRLIEAGRELDQAINQIKAELEAGSG